jgi:hypothetical protein
MSKVQEISVALRFYGDELDPEAISTLLGALPSRSAVKGQRLPSASGRERVAKTSYWHLQSDAVAPDEEFEDHVRRLFDRLTADEEIWRDLGGRFTGDLFVGLFLTDTNEGLVISRQTLSAISARGLEINLDIYGPSDN